MNKKHKRKMYHGKHKRKPHHEITFRFRFTSKDIVNLFEGVQKVFTTPQYFVFLQSLINSAKTELDIGEAPKEDLSNLLLIRALTEMSETKNNNNYAASLLALMNILSQSNKKTATSDDKLKEILEKAKTEYSDSEFDKYIAGDVIGIPSNKLRQLVTKMHDINPFINDEPEALDDMILNKTIDEVYRELAEALNSAEEPRIGFVDLAHIIKGKVADLLNDEINLSENAFNELTWIHNKLLEITEVT